MRDVDAPGEREAQERTWQVVAAAFAERTPARPARLRHLRPVPAVALAAVAVLVAVSFTAPGQAVVTSVRKAIGVDHPRPALFSLPTGGRVLAEGWLVNADGSTRHLGDYRETAWSPFGRFVVGVSGDRLVALDPTGHVYWTLARPAIRFPRWAGTATDTRIAYLSRDRLRIVAGDGTGDHAVGSVAAAQVAPAWRSGTPLVLAYADRHGRVWALEPETGRVLSRTPAGPVPTKVEWSQDGSRLLIVRPGALDVYDANGRLVSRTPGRFVDTAFLPATTRVAALSAHAVSLLGPRRLLFRTTGRLGQVVPSPNGRWLLVTWPDADQWLFVPTAPGRRLSAAANIAEQLGGAFAVGGWTS